MHKHKCIKCGRLWECNRSDMCEPRLCGKGSICKTRTCKKAQDACAWQRKSICAKCMDKLLWGIK